MAFRRAETSYGGLTCLLHSANSDLASAGGHFGKSRLHATESVVRSEVLLDGRRGSCVEEGSLEKPWVGTDKEEGTRACARGSMDCVQEGRSEEHWDPRVQGDNPTQTVDGRMLLREEVVLEAGSFVDAKTFGRKEAEPSNENVNSIQSKMARMASESRQRSCYGKPTCEDCEPGSTLEGPVVFPRLRGFAVFAVVGM